MWLVAWCSWSAKYNLTLCLPLCLFYGYIWNKFINQINTSSKSSMFTTLLFLKKLLMELWQEQDTYKMSIIFNQIGGNSFTVISYMVAQ